MRKIITLIGVILIVLAVTSLFLNNFDYISTIEVPANKDATNAYDVTQPQLLLNSSDTQKLTGIQSSITAYIVIVPSQINQQFNISILIQFPTNVYPNCNSELNINQLCSLGVFLQYTSTNMNPHQVNIVSLERSHSIPVITSGLAIPSSTNRQYYLQINSANSFSYSYNVVARSRFGLFVYIPLFVIGIIVTVVGVVLKGSTRSKTLKKRSWQEPTLGGSSVFKNSSNSAKSKNSSQRVDNSSGHSVKVSTAVSCKKCGGIMPRNSQYCPHCYAKQ